MSENHTTLLAIKPLQIQGEELLKDQWQAFIDSFRSQLLQSGFEDPESTDELLLFSFNHPFPALTAISTCLVNTKETFSATAADGGSPVNIVLHIAPEDESQTPYRDAGANLWEMLEPEKFYISRKLKTGWESFMSQKDLPSCNITNHGEGLFLVEFNGTIENKTETLLSFRGLPVEGGSQKECFYCGMKNHKPSTCPSTFLTMSLDGFGEAGYLPFEKINSLYKKVFQNQDKLTNLLASGITPAQLKKNPSMIVYVSYFDINKIFQLRFLLNMAFSPYTKWEAVLKNEKLQIDNNNLQLGLDCLRVHQYSQAEELLLKENHHKGPKRFYATIGLAFLALERGRLADMGSILELATGMATQEKERIYVALLHSRYFELTNETWKARDIIKNIMSLKPNCQETRYRRIQLEVKGNFTEEAFMQLRSLMVGQRQFFMQVFMDPTLLALQAKVENVLSNQYFTLLHGSKNNLLRASNDIEDLKEWFEKEEPEMYVNLQTLDNLLKRFERKSYFDVLDVEFQAKGLLASGKKLRESKLNALFDKVEKTTTKWTGYYNFWKSYKYKGLFKKFTTELMPLKKKLLKAHELAKQHSGATYKEAVKNLNETQVGLMELKATLGRMNFITFIVTCAIEFGKKLLITELGVAAFGILLGVCLAFVPSGTPLSDIAEMSGSLWFQKRAMIFASLILSPIMALSWTLITISKK